MLPGVCRQYASTVFLGAIRPACTVPSRYTKSEELLFGAIGSQFTAQEGLTPMDIIPAATSSARPFSNPPRRINVIGGGVVAMTTIQQLVDHIDSGQLLPDTRINWIMDRFAHDGGGASPSGGWFAVFSCDDPRAEDWASRSYPWWQEFRARKPDLAPYFEDTPTLLLSHIDQPVIPKGHPGRPTAVNPRRLYGLPQPYGIEMDSGMVINTVRLLPAWAADLAQHPNVNVDPPPMRIAGPSHAADLAAFYLADVTYVAIGLGAIAWGDGLLEPRFGWLLRGPLVPGLPSTHTLMLDDDDLACCYSIPRRTPGDPHAMYGGVVKHLDDLADWRIAVDDEDTRREVLKIARELAEEGRQRAMKEVPMFRQALADVTKLDLWFSFRPYRPTVFADQLDLVTTQGQNLWMLHGLGGSGWTITPAVAADLIARSLESPDRELPVGSS